MVVVSNETPGPPPCSHSSGRFSFCWGFTETFYGTGGGGEGGKYLCNARPKRSDPGKQARRTGATRTMDIKMVGSQPVLCQSNLLFQPLWEQSHRDSCVH